MARILIVEDDDALIRGLVFNLEHEGHTVRSAKSLALARASLAAHAFDLLILDLGLPDGDGTELLRELSHQKAPAAALILSARSTESDVVQGLKLGAEDYIRKPFGLAELLARVELILQRAAQRHLPASAPSGSSAAAAPIDLSGVLIDLRAHTARHPNGQSHPLTPLEIELLKHFLASPGQAHDRQHLLAKVWGLGPKVSTRTLDTHLARLRRKIESDPAQPRHLVTVHGLGYRFDP